MDIMDIITTFFIPVSLFLSLCTMVFVAGKLLLWGMNRIMQAIDLSPYLLSFVRWFFTIKKKQEIPEDLRRRFLTEQEYQMVLRMQGVIDSLGTETLQTLEMKYSELEHPLFIWHDKVFCRSNGNDIIDLETGQLGKIAGDETVSSLHVFDNLVKISSILHMNYKMQQEFDKMGY